MWMSVTNQRLKGLSMVEVPNFIYAFISLQMCHFKSPQVTLEDQSNLSECLVTLHN
jgi:hypothetical protein